MQESTVSGAVGLRGFERLSYRTTVSRGGVNSNSSWTESSEIEPSDTVSLTGSSSPEDQLFDQMRELRAKAPAVPPQGKPTLHPVVQDMVDRFDETLSSEKRSRVAQARANVAEYSPVDLRMLEHLTRHGNPDSSFRLLASGRLTESGEDGVRLIDRLFGLAHGRAEGIQGDEVLQSTMNILARPGCIHQGDRGTCATATTQYLHASEDPHDFARVVDELTKEGEGTARLRSGQTLKRLDSSIPEDRSGRRQVSRLYQDGLMDLTSDWSYRNDAKYKLGEDSPVLEGAFVDETGKIRQGGLTDEQTRQTLEAVRGEPTSTISGDDLSTPEGRKAFDRALEEAQERGSGVSASMRWNDDGVHQRHAVTVLGYTEDGRVRVRNSQVEGWDNSGAHGGPTRAVSTLSGDDFFGGVSLMDRDQFFERLDAFQAPARIAPTSKPSEVPRRSDFDPPASGRKLKGGKVLGRLGMLGGAFAVSLTGVQSVRAGQTAGEVLESTGRSTVENFIPLGYSGLQIAEGRNTEAGMGLVEEVPILGMLATEVARPAIRAAGGNVDPGLVTMALEDSKKQMQANLDYSRALKGWIHDIGGAGERQIVDLELVGYDSGVAEPPKVHFLVDAAGRVFRQTPFDEPIDSKGIEVLDAHSLRVGVVRQNEGLSGPQALVAGQLMRGLMTEHALAGLSVDMKGMTERETIALQSAR